MDLDTTIKSLKVSKENIKEIFEEIIKVDLDDEIKFNIKNVDDIREMDDYPGIRVSLEAIYPPLAVPLKVDVTTGDKITPKEIKYKFKLIFDKNREINILAYNLETVLAEIQENQNMIKQWAVYKNKFNYASEIEFIDTCSTVRDILEETF